VKSAAVTNYTWQMKTENSSVLTINDYSHIQELGVVQIMIPAAPDNK